MPDDCAGFPKVDQLRQGCILSTVVHAIWIARNPDFANEQSWDHNNYSINDSQGTRGTISFAENGVFGAFRDDNSQRIKGYLNNRDEINKYIRNVPLPLIDLAQNQTFRYLYDDFGGAPIPIVTATFWGDDNCLRSTDQWSDVVENGAHILTIHLLPENEAIMQAKKLYQLPDEQLNLAKSMYDRKIKKSDGVINISWSYVKNFVNKGMNWSTESRELLASIGILLQ